MNSGKKKLWISAGICWLLLTRTLIADADDTPSTTANGPVKKYVQAETRQEGHAPSRTGDYCVLPVGDFNGDGRADRAVSKFADDFGFDVVTYILFGDQTLSPEDFSAEFLTRHAGRILRGVAAAPFACVPEWVFSARRKPARTAANLTPAVSKPSNAETSSPIGKPVYYTAVDLTGLNINIAHGINSRGWVVGGSRAFIYDGSALHDLGTLGGDSSTAYAVNTFGHVVGYSLTGETDEFGFVHRAFLFDGVSMMDLGLPPYSAAFDLNDANQIAGASYFNLDEGRVYRGFVYGNDETIVLGTLGGRGSGSEALAINETGQVAGSAAAFVPGTDFGSVRAFLYDGGVMQDLGSLGFVCHDGPVRSCFERSEATDINNRGQIVGFSTTDDFVTHAFLAENSVLKDLGALGGLQSWADAINDSGQTVGASLTDNDAAYHAFLFDQDIMYDLNDLVIDLPDSRSIWGASDINNFGQIVGSNGYLLNPIYENMTPDKQFSFSDTLGRKLSFEYWLSTENSSRCHALMRVEIRFENVAMGRKNRALNRWLPADKFVQACSEFDDWRTASISLPKTLEGKSATIRIRIKTIGQSETPTVYLRHFNKV